MDDWMIHMISMKIKPTDLATHVGLFKGLHSLLKLPELVAVGETCAVISTAVNSSQAPIKIRAHVNCAWVCHTHNYKLG